MVQVYNSLQSSTFDWSQTQKLTNLKSTRSFERFFRFCDSDLCAFWGHGESPSTPHSHELPHGSNTFELLPGFPHRSPRQQESRCMCCEKELERKVWWYSRIPPTCSCQTDLVVRQPRQQYRRTCICSRCRSLRGHLWRNYLICICI